MRQFRPYPLEETFRQSPGLDIGCRISSGTGWLELNAGAPYRLEGSSFGDSATSWRKREVTSDYVEGTFVVNAVRENITETLAVWVNAESWYELENNVNTLTAALCQMSYRLMIRYNDVARYYTCTVADHTVTRQREYLHSCIALVKATVPRHPQDELVYATEDEIL